MLENEKIKLLKTLCDVFEEEGKKYYVSKAGADFIKALREFSKSSNKNDTPFTLEEVIQQPTIDEFKFDGVKEFKFICKWRIRVLEIRYNEVKKKYERSNEKIIPFDFPSISEKQIFDNSKGVVYLLTYKHQEKEHIIKIGQTRNTLLSRMGSYNCGVINNWRTASTTNIKLIQSMVANRLILNVYAIDLSHDNIEYVWHGIKSPKLSSPKNIAYENILISEYIKQFNKKPLFNVQTKIETN